MSAAAFSKPIRAIPRFRPAAQVFGPSALSRAIGSYREARDACVQPWVLTGAYAALARANRTRPENRHVARAGAFRAINRLRVQQRSAWARSDQTEAALIAAGGCAADVDELDARVAEAALPSECVSIEDDPDMAVFAPVRADGRRAA